MKHSVRMVAGSLLLVVALVAARIIFPNKMNFLTEIAIYTIYVMACNLLYGYLGLASFGQPFYLAIGAYSAAIYLAYIGTDPFVSILCGIVSGFLVGLALGPFFVRLRGDYFSLINAATCAIGLFIFERLLIPITRGDDGLWFRNRMTAIPIIDIREPAVFFLFVMVVLLLVLILFQYMDKSVMGVSFRAIRANERKVRFIGYNAFIVKVIGFTIASMMAGLAGALYAVNFGFVNPSLGTPHRAAEVLIATLLGGAGTVYGPFFGALVFLGIRDLVSQYIVQWELFVGILMIIVLFKFREGIWGNIASLLRQKFGDKSKIRGSSGAMKMSCPLNKKGEK